MAPSYRFGKGPIVVALERDLRDRQKFDALYNDLVRALGEIEASGQTTFRSDFKKSLKKNDRDHLDQDVFGAGHADARAAAEGAERRRVYYEGLKRAMDLARRLGPPNAPLPIEIFWGCGQRFNECWISWDKRGAAGVTLFVLSTDPAIGDQDPHGTKVTRFPAGDPAQKGLYVVRPTARKGIEVLRADREIGV
jgi:hypothetical protein